MKKGFTIIELLVVLAIIGILTSVVIASVNRSNQPLEVTCDSYKDWGIQYLPVKCFSYFGVNRTN